MIAQALVTEAIYKSLQDREFNPNINPGNMLAGLNMLNDILDEWRDLIPFSQVSTFTDVAQLLNTPFVSVSQVNYVLNNVQMPLRQVNLTEFNEVQNVLNLTGVPQVWYWDELNQTIKIYPIASPQPYSFTVWGRRAQQPLGLFDELPLNMPRFMIKALTYELAFHYAAEFGGEWNDKKEQIRKEAVANLMGKKSIDLSPQITSVFGRPGGQRAPSFPYFYYLSGGS